MKIKRPHQQPTQPIEALGSMSQTEGEAPFSVLCTLLDAQLIFAETGLQIERLQPLFDAYWPEGSLIQTVGKLTDMGLLKKSAGSGYSVPSDRRSELVAECERYLLGYPFQFSHSTAEFGEVLEDFSRFASQEWKVDLTAKDTETGTWGGRVFRSGGHVHHLLLRPNPLELRAHAEAFVLVLCSLPDAVIHTVTEHFARSRALRQRFALYDLAQSQRINLTRSDVFVFFERYLRRVHGLRMAPPAALTQSLVDGGILSLEMG